MKRRVLGCLLLLCLGQAIEAAELTISGSDRPCVGSTLTAVCSEDGSTFVWTRGSTKGVFETSAVSTDAAYTLKTADLEHWIRVVAYTNGVAAATNQIWFSKLPVVYLTTDGGAAIADKVNYVSGNIRIQGNKEFAEQYNGRMEIKGRGNSSWGFPQKPYKIKLDKKTSLFGFGKNKHWVLISNYVDNSFMRNKHGSELAKELDIVGMDMTWVVVFVNGTYNGVEMLAEHIRIDKNRVNITDWESNAEDVADELYKAAKKSEGWNEDDQSALEEEMVQDLSWMTSGAVSYKGKTCFLADYRIETEWNLNGGYLYEMDGRFDETSKFQTVTMKTKINISKPEFAATDPTMYAAAQKFWNDFESAYLSLDSYTADGRHISDLADVDSMVAYWLTMDCLGNIDSRAFSRYSYVDVGGKLIMGPAWDFDYGGGSISVQSGYGDAALPNHWAVCCFGQSTTGTYPGSDFYCEWLDDPAFVLKAYEMYWQKVHPWMAAQIAEGGGMDDMITYLTEAGAAHDTKFKRWGFSGTSGDVAKYRAYLKTRLAWLDQQFASVDTLMTSVKNKTSAHPYEKRTDLFAFSVAGAEVTNAVCQQDFRLTSGVPAYVRLSVMTDAVARVAFYVDGLKCGSVEVADYASECTIPVEALTASSGQRDIVQIIAYDSAAKMVGRSYMTILKDADMSYGLVADIDDVAKLFPDDAEAQAGITNAATLAQFNIFLDTCGIASVGSLTAAQRKHAYQSFKVSSFTRSPVLLEADPEMSITSFSADETETGAWKVVFSLTEGDYAHEIALAKEAVRARVKKSDDISAWQTLEDDEIVSSTEDGEKVKLTISPKSTSNSQFIKFMDK